MDLIAALALVLVPRLRAQNVMHILDHIVFPNLVMYALRPHGLQRVVCVRQRHPASVEQVAEQRLVGEVVVAGRLIGQLFENKVVYSRRGVYDLQATVGHSKASRRVCAFFLREVGIAMLGSECAVLWNPGTYQLLPPALNTSTVCALPVLGVMRLLERIAHACMAGREHSVALACCARRVKLQLHQLVHVLQHQHVAVELHYAIVLLERERCQLAPAVVESRVVCEVFLDLGQQVLDMLLGYAALIERFVALFGERVCVERDERVLGAVLLQAVVEGEEAREVSRVCDQRRPYCKTLVWC